MNYMSSSRFFLFAAFLIAGSVAASAENRFSLGIGSHDMLIVSGPTGEHRATLPLPSVSQIVTIDSTTCQISFGRDANNLLTAIVSASPSAPQDLHFDVLGKAIDTDKSAVVTLIFSRELKSVKIDPGYIGRVEVDSHRLPHNTAAKRSSSPISVAATSNFTDPEGTLSESAHRPTSAVAAASTNMDAAPAPVTLPVSMPSAVVAANQTANVPSSGDGDGVSIHAPLPMQVNDASQMPFTATATPGPSTVSVSGSQLAPKQHSLYWAEPITPPGGKAPQVGSNEMKLTEVKGSVSIQAPGAANIEGADGMLVPSGSVVSTSGGSSAALFMGGVNSIRLMPDTEIQVTQKLNGGTRSTLIALHEGSVFSRVGHRDGEKQDYQVQSPQGTATAKGTEFADTVQGGHHYVYVVKGIVAMIMNGVQTGLLTPTHSSLASGAMPPATDGDKVLFAVLNALQPFQTKLQQVIADINNGTATPAELGFFDNLRSTFAVLVDDVYDPTHPNSFLGAFTSLTGFGDSNHSTLERPQDFMNPNPLNPFNGFQQGAAHPFFTPSITPTSQAEIAPIAE